MQISSKRQKMGGIDMLSHRHLFSLFSSFFRQLPLDILSTIFRHSNHYSEFNVILIYGAYQYKTLH